MEIKTWAINAAGYITTMSGVKGEVIWENGRNRFIFPETEELRYLFNKYKACIEAREGLDIDLVHFMGSVRYYRNIIDEDRANGKHLI